MASIEKDGRRWRVRYDAPRLEDGARRQRMKRGFRTRREAEAWARDTLGRIDRGTWVPPTRLTLNEWLSVWLDPAAPRKRPIRPTTLTTYRIYADTYLRPRLGHRQLQSLVADDLDRLYRELLTGGGRGGRPLAPKTVRHVHVLAHTCLAAAVRKGHLEHNPADRGRPAVGPPPPPGGVVARRPAGVPRQRPGRPAGRAVDAGRHHRDAPRGAARRGLGRARPGRRPAGGPPDRRARRGPPGAGRRDQDGPRAARVRARPGHGGGAQVAPHPAARRAARVGCGLDGHRPGVHPRGRQPHRPALAHQGVHPPGAGGRPAEAQPARPAPLLRQQRPARPARPACPSRSSPAASATRRSRPPSIST